MSGVGCDYWETKKSGLRAGSETGTCVREAAAADAKVGGWVD